MVKNKQDLLGENTVDNTVDQKNRIAVLCNADFTPCHIESGHIGGIYHGCLTSKLDILLKENFWVSNIQARAPTEAVILNRSLKIILKI